MTLSLATEGLSVGYDGLAVARGIDLQVASRQVLAVLGPNGAGKSTLLLTLAGLLPPIDGSIEVGGQHLKAGSARRASRAGVVLVPDSRALFTQLTAKENLLLAAKRPELVDEAMELFPALGHRAGLKAGSLSGGEAQMLAVARALVQEPRVLLIDEMSMGLAPVVVESLMPVIRRVADEREAAVVLVEQHVHLALDVADLALVLVHGDVVLRGTSEDVRSDALALESAYLGDFGRVLDPPTSIENTHFNSQ
ncbi:MAG TPA: ATP-binding cassette domain-containing protein [Microthrixaceae bacterium]|nr:ATP-binding cassette domain-containing protein [Microthrixaceae bacterium]